MVAFYLIYYRGMEVIWMGIASAWIVFTVTSRKRGCVCLKLFLLDSIQTYVIIDQLK